MTQVDMNPTLNKRKFVVALVVALSLNMLALTAVANAAHPINKPRWLPRTTITEYYPVPESWFVGALTDTPGLVRQSRIDWLYSASGMAMEGDGIGLDGKPYHIENVGSSGWIAKNGKQAAFGTGGDRAPFWRGAGYWRNRYKAVTFPFALGGWSNGIGKRYVPPGDITFAAGPSLSLSYYRSVAVDPKLIPIGSLVYAAQYSAFNHDGWFRAVDTGSAIIGHHIDVYRSPPASSTDGGRLFKNARIFVVPAKDVAKYIQRERIRDTDGLPAPPASLASAPTG